MIRQNIKVLKPLKMNMWRKVALNSWNRPNEPVIYSKVTLRPEKALAYLKELNKTNEVKITMTHFLGKVCGIVLKRHEDINSTILYKKAYVRKGSDIFFHVSHIDEDGKENLSGVKVDDCGDKSIAEIATELNREAKVVKTGNDVTFNKIKKIMKLTPMFLVNTIVRVTAYIQYRLNLWSPAFGTKQDSFGSMMITNIGSLGIEEAFVPFSHYTNVNSIIDFGKTFEAPVVENGEVKVGLSINACWTLDHRVIDGSNAAKMLETFRHFFESPENIDLYDQENS